ncbi:8599_t:CDS:1, partial [Cetraspora pellucida]
MELAPLGSLNTYLKDHFCSMTWEEKITALLDISMGLYHLHKSDLIHRDFHPGNLLYSVGKNLLITDLGLCQSVNQNLESEPYGNKPYTAPEIFLEKKQYSTADDIYSFGWVAYEIIVGPLPDEYKKIDNTYNRPKIPKYVPERIAKLIWDCWKKETDRPTAECLRNTIKRCYRSIKKKKQNEFTKEVNNAEKMRQHSAFEHYEFDINSENKRYRQLNLENRK